MAYQVIQNGEIIGTSETIEYIFLGRNGAYQSCDKNKANGFCVKLPKTYTTEDGTEETILADKVFVFPGHMLAGDEPEATVADPELEPPKVEVVTKTGEDYDLLKAQVDAQSDQMDFYEECIVELAGVVYA